MLNSPSEKLFCHSIIFLIAGSLFCGFMDSANSLNQKANKLYRDKRYQSADELYQKAQIKNPKSAEIQYNLGTALYQLDQYRDSHHHFEGAIQKTKDKSVLARTYYNYGNSLYRLGQFDEAIASYKKTLDLNPSDKDAKHNLELLLKKKDDFQKQQDKRNQNQKNNQKNQNNPQSQSQNNQKNNQSGSQDNQNQGAGSQVGKEPEKSQPEQLKPGENSSEAGVQDQKTPRKDENEGRTDQDKPTAGSPTQQESNVDVDQVQARSDQADQMDSEKSEKNEPSEQKNYFQGQMSTQDAMRILDALKDSEKKMQILRRPKPQREEDPIHDMDW